LKDKNEKQITLRARNWRSEMVARVKNH
jgi:hypothetical protein